MQLFGGKGKMLGLLLVLAAFGSFYLGDITAFTTSQKAIAGVALFIIVLLAGISLLKPKKTEEDMIAEQDERNQYIELKCAEKAFRVALYASFMTIIAGMIAFGLWMLFGGHGGSNAGFDNLWKHGGFLATGWHGLILSLAVIMFSFGGLELIGITAAEAQNPEKSIPKAVNQVVYRILLFYIGSLVVLLALYPWVEIKSDSSPFVMIFHNLDSNLVASALNFVILVASLSVYNSGVYSNSRMLFGLSVQGNAPKFLARVSKRGVPVNSLLLSGIITSLVVVLNYLLPHEALGLLMALVVATLLLNWIMICMAHLKFRAAQRRKGRESKFKALLAPASNYFCIAFLGLILALMCTIDGMRLSAILLPVWILFLFIAFKLLRRPA